MKKKAVEEQKLRRRLSKQEPVGSALEACRRQVLSESFNSARTKTFRKHNFQTTYKHIHIVTIDKQVEELQQGLESQEREAVERASQVERQQFLSVARALQPVLEQQAVLACNHLPSSSNLSDLITSLADMAEEQRSSTAELDSMIRLVDNKKTPCATCSSSSGTCEVQPQVTASQLHHLLLPLRCKGHGVGLSPPSEALPLSRSHLSPQPLHICLEAGQLCKEASHTHQTGWEQPQMN